MKALQKWVSGFAILALLLALAGCGGQSQSTGGSSTGTAGETAAGGEKAKTIGMSFPAADHGWLGAIIKNAEDEAKAQGIQYVITTAADPNKQTNDVEDLISQKVDAIVMLPIESAALTPVAKKVKEAGIPLVIVDREIESDDFTALVKGDNKGIGQGAGKYLAEQLGGTGKIVEIIGVPSSVTTLRSEGFREAIQDHPGMEIIVSQSGDFQKEKSLHVMQNILQSQPQIDAVYTHDDEMALGVLQAIKEANRTDIKIVTGAGGHKDVYKLIKDGDSLLKATFIYSPLMVKDAVKVAVDIVNGKTPSEKEIVLEAAQVTQENVDQYYDENANY
ncbi:substrate-binding domain-containing protein [Brevibacillus humidisoli]|uniref:substrate-binding domain-containing protein n=1 Tax=Brevibacillus humidisoli TaxID=2895522 RepID=UPI001E4386C4|nr:substrate-binding domain-containing protein [Brevibacillus humidisoli]UFJ40815.1 substrate-binding domain-containing protein [Brevibacillus humidisoli]